MRITLLALCLFVAPNFMAGQLAVKQVADSTFLADPWNGVPEFSSIVTYNNELYFTSSTAGDGTHRLFKTDGQKVQQFNVDPGFAIGTQFQEFDGQLYFRGDDGDGIELFRTDGNSLTKFDLSTATYGSWPHSFFVFDDKLYFSASILDGSGELHSTLMSLSQSTVTHVANTDRTASYAWAFPIGNQLYFTANGADGFELYRKSGTETRQIIDANPGPEGSDPQGASVLNGEFYFTARTPTGRELFKTNGDSVTKLPLPADPTPSGGPFAFLPFGNSVYFTAKSDRGYELFRTDGASITEFDLNPGPENSYPNTFGGDVLGDKLLVSASGPNGLALFVFNTTGELSRRLDIFGDQQTQSPPVFHLYKGEAYFEATGPDGPELYKTDGDTLTKFDIVPDNSSRAFVQMWGAVDFNGELFFAATTTNGIELLKTDGTQFTTFDINPGIGDSSPRDLQILGDQLVFRADGATGQAIYSTDGNAIRKLMDLEPNYLVDGPLVHRWQSSTNFARLNDELFFLANTPTGFHLQRIAEVPEPATLVLIILSVVGLNRRQRLVRQSKNC